MKGQYPLKTCGGARVLYRCRQKGMKNCPFEVELRYEGATDVARVYTKGEHHHEEHQSKFYFPENITEKVAFGVKSGLTAMKIRNVRITFQDCNDNLGN